MSSLQQHLADTAANLNAQLCELNELRAGQESSAINPEIAATKLVEWARRNLTVLTKNGP